MARNWLRLGEIMKMEVWGRACSGHILTLKAPNVSLRSLHGAGAHARMPFIIQSQKLYIIGGAAVVLP